MSNSKNLISSDLNTLENLDVTREQMMKNPKFRLMFKYWGKYNHLASELRSLHDYLDTIPEDDIRSRKWWGKQYLKLNKKIDRIEEKIKKL